MYTKIFYLLLMCLFTIGNTANIVVDSVIARNSLKLFVINNPDGNININGNSIFGNSLFVNNNKSIYTKNSTGEYEFFLTGRDLYNKTIIRYGAGGFFLGDNNLSKIAVFTDNNKIGFFTTTPESTVTLQGSSRINGNLFISGHANINGLITGTATNSVNLNNQPSTYYLSRSNHTGTQAISTIAGLQTELDARPTGSGSSGRLTVWTGANTVGQTGLYYSGNKLSVNTTNFDSTFNVNGSSSLGGNVKINGNLNVIGTIIGTLSGTATNSVNLNNQPSTYYLSRSNHTGTQAISTIAGLQTALDARPTGSGSSGRLTVWTGANTVGQTGLYYSGNKLSVNTTNFDSTFNVNGGSNFNGKIVSKSITIKSDVTNQISFFDNANSSSIGYIGRASTGSDTLFIESYASYPGITFINSTTRTMILSNGKVGVRTFTLDSIFNVNGSSNLSGNVRVGGNLNVVGDITCNAAGAASGTVMIYNNGLKLASNLVYTNSGRIGLNFTNPDSTLTIGGSAKVTMNMRIGGNLDVVGGLRLDNNTTIYAKTTDNNLEQAIIARNDQNDLCIFGRRNNGSIRFMSTEDYNTALQIKYSLSGPPKFSFNASGVSDSIYYFNGSMWVANGGLRVDNHIRTNRIFAEEIFASNKITAPDIVRSAGRTFAFPCTLKTGTYPSSMSQQAIATGYLTLTVDSTAVITLPSFNVTPGSSFQVAIYFEYYIPTPKGSFNLDQPCVLNSVSAFCRLNRLSSNKYAFLFYKYDGTSTWSSYVDFRGVHIFYRY